MAGIWPVQPMLYRNNQMDEASMIKLTNWYIDRGVEGIFSVCQSSEMFYLSVEERTALAELTVKTAAGRVPVVACGHVEDDLKEQIASLDRLAQTGVDALVLSSNRLGDGDDASFERDVKEIMRALPGAKFGVYECPMPFKRLLTEGNLKMLADTGRFIFIKDTCCDADLIRARLNWLSGSTVKLFNANGATFGQSVWDGCAGYSGVMANIHPELYVWFCQHPDAPEADELQKFLGLCSVIEARNYPIVAKYLLQKQGFDCTLESRSADPSKLISSFKLEADQLLDLTHLWHKRLGITV